MSLELCIMEELRIHNLTPPELVRKYFIFNDKGSLIHDYCYRLGIPFSFDETSNLCEVELSCDVSLDIEDLKHIDWKYLEKNSHKKLIITHRFIQVLTPFIVESLNYYVEKHNLHNRVWWWTQNPLDKLYKGLKFNLAFFDSLSNVYCECAILTLNSIKKGQASWEDLAFKTPQTLFNISQKKLELSTKHFTFFSHRPTAPRFLAYHLIKKYKLLDKAEYSFWGIHERKSYSVDAIEDLKNTIPNYPQILSDCVDVKKLDTKSNLQFDAYIQSEECYEIWSRGLINYANESSAIADNEIYLTEKTFANLALGRPFLLNGNRGTLQYLKKYYKFKTFDLLFDESYDMISSYEDRVYATTEQLVKFCSQSFEEAFQKVKALQPILDHNSRIFSNLPHTKNFLSIFNDI